MVSHWETQDLRWCWKWQLRQQGSTDGARKGSYRERSFLKAHWNSRWRKW